MKREARGFISGILVMLLLVSMIGSASAATGKVQKTLEYRNIAVTLNGTKLDLRDAKGNSVEPFMFDGTNYLPVRALSEALGLNVSWNSSTNTVVLTGGTAGQGDSLKSIKCMGFYSLLSESAGFIKTTLNTAMTTSSYYTTDSGAASNRASAISLIQNSLPHLQKMYTDAISADAGFNDSGLYSRYINLAGSTVSLLQALGSSGMNSTTLNETYQLLTTALTLETDAGQAYWDIYFKVVPQ